MKPILVIALAGFFVLAGAAVAPPATAQPFNFWSHDIASSAFDQVGGIALDSAGNVYATGAFQGVVALGWGTWLISNGERDVFLAKYAPDGTLLWARSFGDADVDVSFGIAVDAAGNVAIVGGFDGSISFGPEAGGTSAGGTDAFVAVFDTDGNTIWGNVYGAAQSDYANGVTFLPSGDLVVSGAFANTVDFGGGGLTSAGDGDAFVVRFSGNDHVWSQRYGSTGFDVGVKLATDSNANIILGGLFTGTVSFGGGNLVGAGNVDIALAKYNENGGHLWSQSFGSAGSESIDGISIGEFDDICVTGMFENTVDFGGGGIVSGGLSDVYLARYTTAGTHRWSQGFGGVDWDRGYGVDRLANGNIVITGRFVASIDFGGGALISPGQDDGFAAEFDTTGAYISDQHYATSGGESSRDIKADDGGGFVIMGYYDTDIDFGSGELSAEGSADVFIARFGDGVANPAITSIVDVDNDEGREVRITFDASLHDHAASATQVLNYEVYRRDDAAPAPVADIDDGPMRIEGWTYVASAPSHGEDSYNILAPTIGDSTVSSGLYESVFFIRAATAAPTVFWDSDPDSGYSLDNLAPPAPSSIVYNAGLLAWDDSEAPDFDYFAVYGGYIDDFNNAAPIGISVSAGFDVSGVPYAYFFITANDFAGNESSPGSPQTPTGIGATSNARQLSLSAHPNPFNPSTTITFNVPASGYVNLNIYDARGALVKTLADGVAYGAGRHTMRWNARNDAGDGAPSGVYFARIEHGSATHTQKIVLLK